MDEIKSAVVELFSLTKPSSILGTGFWLNDNLIVTCCHIFPDAETIKEGYQVGFRDIASKADGMCVIYKLSREFDLAVFSASTPFPVNAQILPLGLNIVYGNQFRSFGFRKGSVFLGLDSKGEIRSMTLAKQRSGYWADVIQLYTNEVDSGMSGAPIYDTTQKRIIGIISSYWQTSKVVDGYLAFGIPISKLIELLPEITEIHPELNDPINQNDQVLEKQRLFPSHLPIPRYVRRFDNRGRDLANNILVDLLSENQHGVTIWGAGGVGKSTLAIEVIHRIHSSKNSIFDIVWTTADGRQSYNTETILDDIFLHLGEEHLRTRKIEEKLSAITRLLVARQIVLVVDNFETIEDKNVVEFLSTLPCRILITSRIQTNIPGEKAYLLNKMTLDESREFINNEIENFANQPRLRTMDADTLAKTCDGNPMVIRWALGLFEHFYTIDDIAEALKSAEGDAANRVFKRTYDLLTAKEKDMILSLALFFPSCDPNIMEMFFSLPRQKLVPILSRLSKYALIETDISSSRIWLVALTRQLAYAQLKNHPKQFSRISKLFVKSYLDFVDRFVSNSKPFAELRIEEENLFTAMDLALEVKRPESVVRLIKLLGGGLGYFDLQSSWRKAMFRLSKALEIIGPLDSNIELLGASFEIGRGYYHIGEYESAMKYYQLALDRYKILGDTANTAFVILHMGRLARIRGLLNEALGFFDEGLKVAEENDDLKNQGIILNELGAMALHRGDYEIAQNYFEECLRVKKQVGEKNAIGITMYQLGNLFVATGNNDEANKYFLDALEIFRMVGNRRDMASCMSQIAWIKYILGHFSECRSMLTEGTSLYQELGDQRGLSRAMYYWGRLELSNGNKFKAKENFTESLRIATEIQSLDVIGLAEYGLGLAHDANAEVSLAHLGKSMEIFSKLKHPMHDEVSSIFKSTQAKLE